MGRFGDFIIYSLYQGCRLTFGVDSAIILSDKENKEEAKNEMSLLWGNGV